MNKQHPAQARSERGVALVITLSMLVLITVLVVGFTVNMRTEHQASAAMTGAAQAGLVAQSALAHAVSLLQKNIPQPVPPIPQGSPTPTPVNWVVNPGLLTTVQGTQGSATIRKIPLSSNPTDTYVSTVTDANLNLPSFDGSENTILPTSQEMRVAWVPILQDPSSAAGPATATKPTNQIVGRYAFWIDDECGKININTALGKPSGLNTSAQTPGVVTVQNSTYPVGHPASVNLDMLGSLYLYNAPPNDPVHTVGLAQWISGTSPFASVEEIKPFVTGNDKARNSFVTQNKFNLSAWSRAPEFNVFGKSRLFLLRGQPILPAHTFQFFRDLDAPMYFHARENTSTLSDGTALYYTAKALTSLFSRRDWPGMPPSSFLDKWSSGTGGLTVGQREADQIAWNIIARGNFSDYNPYVTDASASPGSTTFNKVPTADDYFRFDNYIPVGQEGSSGSANLPNRNLQFGPTSKKAILPALPFPLIDEVCLQVLPESVSVKVGGVATPMYRLKITTAYEFWNPPSYPQFDTRAANRSLTVGLTYLSVQATQGTLNVVQEDAKYLTPSTPNGVLVLYAGKSDELVTPDERFVIQPADTPTTNKTLYVRTDPPQGGFSASTTGVANFDPTKGPVTLDVKMRVFARISAGISTDSTTGLYNSNGAFQLIPVWDRHDPGVLATPGWNKNPASSAVSSLTPPTDDASDYIEFKFDIDLNTLGGSIVTRSREVNDPRTGGLYNSWVKAQGFDQQTNAKADTLNAKNAATTLTTDDGKKFAFLDFSNASPQSPRPPIGMFSTIPTGMQRGLTASTLNLQPGTPSTDLPDWLLLDLLAPSVESSMPNSPTASNPAGTPSGYTLSRMNSTAGKVNINAAILPQGGAFAPPMRGLPLQAVFQNMSGATTVGGTPPTTLSNVVQNVINHTLASNGKDYGAQGAYDYVGELCEIAGVADAAGASDWDKEYLIRNLASTLTTQSNVFSVWGVSQAIKKVPKNTNYGVFEAGDVVAGERRFQAIVERYVWPGTDNSAGNAHAVIGGGYDQLSSGQTKPGIAPSTAGTTADWEKLDGPDAPTYPVTSNTVGKWQAGNVTASYQPSTLEQAVNPVRATMKYRVLAFRYLNN